MPTKPAHSAPTLPSLDAASLFEAVPSALLQLDAQGVVVAGNAAARRLLGPTAEPGVRVGEALGLRAGSWPVEPVRQPGTTAWLGLRVTALDGGGSLVQIDDISAQVAATQEVTRLGELLDLTQDFGRLGIWQRDVRTLRGSWDRHVYKFWGLNGDAGAPDFEAAARQIVEEDREPFQAAFMASMQAAGIYAHRYRVRRPDGYITHLHSQWAVKNGADGRPERVIGIMMDDTEAVAHLRARSEMESQLALAEALAGLIIWRHDLKSDRIQFNREGLALFQLAPDPDGVPLAAVRALIHPDDVPAAAAAADAAMTGQRHVDVELRYQLPDGSCPQLLTRRVAQRDEHGVPVALLGVALDITERSAQTRRARELSDRFELATRTAGIGYWSREGEAQRAYWSDQMRALHGLAADAPVPTLKDWISSFVHPEDRESIRERFREWLSGHAPRVQSELRVVRTDGAVRHLMTHSLQERGGAVPVLFGIAVDITDRRAADLALRRADERAALAARGAGIGTWEVDRRDDSVFWDEQMWRLRGREPRPQAPTEVELLGFVHPEDTTLASQRMNLARHADEVVEHDFRVVWPDGQVRWLASRSASLRDASGQVVRRIGVNWDVTAARQAEAARREREAAERANQTKSRFLARMSHELRTPLNAVLGFTQLLLLDDSSAQRRPRLEHIHAAGQHLLSLIDDVLDLASLDTGELRIQPETVDLAALVAATLPLIEPLRAERGITLDVQVGMFHVRADPVRLRQVLLNLLSNACKYNRAHGRVEIAARAEGEEVVLAVRDSGRGMNETQLEHLYEPFNRLGIQREGIEGTGIGLAIVKALLERMHGSIQVRSQPEVGTVFEVRLPAAATERLDPQRGVLYIEDNAVNSLIVRELMQRRPDIRLLQAGDGRGGLALARREQPALVLLDMQLPDMDGLAVLAQLRAEPATAGMRCIAVSANALPEDVDRALAAGVAAYWTKPLDAAAFTGAIDALFGPPRL